MWNTCLRWPGTIFDRRSYGRGRTRVHRRPPRSALGVVAATQRGHNATTCSAVCDNHTASAHGTCRKRPSRLRLSASPHRVWLVPGVQACTSPDGCRTPSSSTHWLDAATHGWELTPAVYPPGRGRHRVEPGPGPVPSRGTATRHTTGVTKPAVDVADTRSTVLRRYWQHVVEFALLTLAVLLAVVLGALAAVPLIKLGVPPEAFTVLPMSAAVAVAFLGTLWVEIWYPHRHGGSTPAMRWLGLRIVTLRGGTPSVRDYFVRWLLMAVDGMLLGLVGAVLIAVTPRHQRLGDLVARTVVVRREVT